MLHKLTESRQEAEVVSRWNKLLVVDVGKGGNVPTKIKEVIKGFQFLRIDHSHDLPGNLAVIFF